jgi:hypothetical protein
MYMPHSRREKRPWLRNAVGDSLFQSSWVDTLPVDLRLIRFWTMMMIAVYVVSRIYIYVYMCVCVCVFDV